MINLLIKNFIWSLLISVQRRFQIGVYSKELFKLSREILRFTGWLLKVGLGGNCFGEIPAKPLVKNKLFQMAHARRSKFNSINTGNKE